MRRCTSSSLITPQLTVVLGMVIVLAASTARAQPQFIIELRNGMRLGPGVPTETDSLSTNVFQRGGSTGNKSILKLDDGLRYTYINQAPINVLATRESTAPPEEQIELPSAAEAARSGNSPSIQGVLGVSEFNAYGRRTFSFMTNRGRVDVLQGITLLTPTFAKVEVLRTGTEEFVWDQRIATSSIPAGQLREILYQALDLNKSSEWLLIVSFYTQAERFVEARDVMAEALVRFPAELADRAAILPQLDQLLANQKFDEIQLRRDAGQQQLAAGLLGSFPVAALSLENQVKLEEQVTTIQQQLLVVSEIATALRAQAEQLPEADQQLVAALIDEIENEVNLESVVRLSDFQRLRRDDTIGADNLIAYALGGWILGPGSGIDNLAVAKSLIRVRELVIEYLNEASSSRREEILQALTGEEGAEPQMLAKLLNFLKPPQAPPPHDESDPAGFFRLRAPTANSGEVDYVVQLPPEYDPNRKYPCVLALPGRGELPETEIDWWCGIHLSSEDGEFRFGQATRFGYIVLAPRWMTDNQTQYDYTEAEQARILSCLRDGLRKFSIDTDRVFVSGHYDGATAAWDLAGTHPDLWAGAIMVSPGADKYIVHYSENLKASKQSPDQIPLGTYIVYGDSDGTRIDSKLGTVATRYLNDPAYDSMVVEYRGNGRARFSAELPRIMEWMELSSHRRVRAPRNIETRVMRTGDRMFYWLEAPSLLPKASGNPFQFDPANSGLFQARLLDSAINGVMISNIPSQNRAAIVWLSPEMVDFGRTITVTHFGKRSRHDLAPDIRVMLEDVRTRGDRQHFFWQKITL